MPPRIPFVIGILAWCFIQYTHGRASTRVRLPMPTSETIPYVAEVMGATSYEESIEEVSGEVKRVQRKLTGPDHKEPDLDQEDQYAEYQGVIGRPGVDFPVLPNIPRTDFSCRKVKSSGYYADLETGCQVFHICDGGRKISFLCPNGTIFRQSHLICDWWFRVDCERSVEQYEESAEQLAHDQMIYKKRAEEIAKAMTTRLVTTEESRSTSSESYDAVRQQQRRKPTTTARAPPQQEEQERQVPAETASFASNRHRFNQIENQYRQYFATSPSPFSEEQNTYDYNTETQSLETQEPEFVNNAQNNFESTKNNKYQVADNYANNNNEFESTKNAKYQAPNNNNYVNKNNYQGSNSNYPDANNNYPNDNSNYPNTNSNYPNANGNYPNANGNYPNANGNYPNANGNYPNSNGYYPNSNNNYHNTNSNSPNANSNYPNANSNYPNANSNYPQTQQNNNYQNVHNYHSTNNYPTSTSRNYPTTTSNYYNNNNNNYPVAESKTFNNYNSLSNKNYTYNSNNYSGNSNTYTQKNNNPNRGNTNYFTNNKNYESDSKYPADSSSSQYTTNKYSNYNYTNTEKGTTYTIKSEKYSEYSKSVSKSDSDDGQSSQSSYAPTASTTIRSVTSKQYNDNTPKYDKYTGKHKQIFNVKIKPTKDFAYVELLRSEESNNPRVTPPKTPVEYNTENPSVEENTYHTIPVSQLVTTLSPVTVTQTNSRNTYLPKQSTTNDNNKKNNNIEINPVTNRYASINVSGTAEEIRPEIVNNLMERGVTPTSAKALHSLASYISSGAAEEDYVNVYNDGNHPHVSDVILNFHSGSPVTPAYGSTETTTTTPITSSGEILPSVLTNATKESYSYLFSDSKELVDYKNEESKTSPKAETTTRSTTTQKPSTTTQKPRTTTTQRPQENKVNPNKQKEDLKLKDSSELRELAQVFSRALSAYLEDPETFKEILAQVRPTEPNVDNTTPSVEDEVLDFSDAMLGRLGSTLPPVTTFGNSDYIDDNLNIGDINSLASDGSKTFEPDNSIEHNTFPPTAPEAFQDNKYTSTSPKFLLFNDDQIRSNDYYSKLGSAEDESYFPTAGGVSDTSRPRYGGFQNNTNKTPKPYSPYGSDLPKNITGLPISNTSPTKSPDISVYTKTYNSTSTANIPEPRDVNSLIKSNVLNSDHSSSEESYESYQTSPSFLQEESYYPSSDQEKFLITAGSQSLVSSDNYIQFAKKFNEQAQLEGKKYQESLFKVNPLSNSAPLTSVEYQSNNQEDLSPYFGQQPPLESLAKPSGFKIQVPYINNEANVQNKSEYRPYYTDVDPINYHIGVINEGLATPAPLISTNKDYDVSYGDFISSKSPEVYTSPTPSSASSSWTVSPLYDVTSAGTSILYNYTQKSFPSSTNRVSTRFYPTTYHPPHSSEYSSEVSSNSQWETTLQTENSITEESTTTTAYDLIGSATTINSQDRYKDFEKAAKEMFGMLNETAAKTLMDMMAKGESNMTIRRLVLLLVNDMARNNLTTEESREHLLNALLTNTEEVVVTTPAPKVVSSSKLPRKKVRISRVRVTTPTPTSTPTTTVQSSSKYYRATDTMTGVHGSLQSPSELNKINAAKLYIPSPTYEPLTNNKLPLDSDARAVELLKTLYSLAAKWG